MNAAAPMLCVAPLFVPGDRPERFEKAAASGADAIIIDLEDAIAPSAKAAARAALSVDFTTLPVFVRVNAVGTPWHKDDLDAVDRLAFAGIMIPKAEASVAFSEMSARHPIVALIETARGLADARTIAAHPRVARLAFGSIDFCADIGCAHQRGALQFARCEIVLASRLANIPAPLDGVTTALDGGASAQDDARHANELGFGGKLCIHPRQVAAVFTGMAPNEAEIVWARRVLAAEDGVAVIENAMIDEAVKLRARRVLARAGGESCAVASPLAARP